MEGAYAYGALQQMLSQVEWGDLDALIVDLPPGTGDVQLTLCQKAELSGAIIVSHLKMLRFWMLEKQLICLKRSKRPSLV